MYMNTYHLLYMYTTRAIFGLQWNCPNPLFTLINKAIYFIFFGKIKHNKKISISFGQWQLSIDLWLIRNLEFCPENFLYLIFCYFLIFNIQTLVHLIFFFRNKIIYGRYIFGLRTYYIKPTKKEYFSPCLISVSNFCCRDLRQFGQKSNCFKSKDLPLLP